jgi:hypothetical protein
LRLSVKWAVNSACFRAFCLSGAVSCAQCSRRWASKVFQMRLFVGHAHVEAHLGRPLADHGAVGGGLLRGRAVFAADVFDDVLALGRDLGVQLERLKGDVGGDPLAPSALSRAVSSPPSPTTHQGQTTSETKSIFRVLKRSVGHGA